MKGNKVANQTLHTGMDELSSSLSQWTGNYLSCLPYLVRFCLTLKERLAHEARTRDWCYCNHTGRCYSSGCGHGNHNTREPPFLQEVYGGVQTQDLVSIQRHENSQGSLGVSSLSMSVDTFPPKKISARNDLQRTPNLIPDVNMSPALLALPAMESRDGQALWKERRKSTERKPTLVPTCGKRETGREGKEPQAALVSDIPGLVPLRLSSCLWMTRTPIQSSKHSYLLCDDGKNATPLQHAGDCAK